MNNRQQQQEDDDKTMEIERGFLLSSGGSSDCDCGGGGGSGQATNSKPKSQQTSSLETKTILISGQLHCKINCKLNNNNNANKHKENYSDSKIQRDENNCDPFNHLHNNPESLEQHSNQQLPLIPYWVLVVLKKSLASIRARRCLQIQKEEQKLSSATTTNINQQQQQQQQHYQLASEPMEPSHAIDGRHLNHLKGHQNDNCFMNNPQEDESSISNKNKKKKKLSPKRVKRRISKIISLKEKSSSNKSNFQESDTDDIKSKGFYFAGFGSHETSDTENDQTGHSMTKYNHNHNVRECKCKTLSLYPDQRQEQFFSPSSQRQQKHYYVSTAGSGLIWSTPQVFPNNTLIADLTQCHPTLIHQLPDLGLEASSKRLLFGLNQCWKPAKEEAKLQKLQSHLISNNRDQQSKVSNKSPQQLIQFASDIYGKRRKSSAREDASDTRIAINEHDTSRLGLDFMIPKTTNSLPTTLMSQLDAESLLRLQAQDETYLNSRITKNDTKCSEIYVNKTDNNYPTNCNKKNKSICKKQQRKRRASVKFEMPEALLAARVRLKREDYDKALCVLTSDFRYKLHLILYSRIQSLWLLMSTILCMFIPFVFLVPELNIILMSSGLWLFLQLVGGLATFAMRKSLNRILERAVAQANSYFMDFNLMLGVINLGGLFASSKLMLPLVYFDTTPCRLQIESILGTQAVDKSDIKGGISIINKKTYVNSSREQLAVPSALAKSQMAKKIVLKYSQRWISQYDRRKLVFSGDDDDQIEPRHLSTGKCICQFFEAQYLEATRVKNIAQQLSTSEKMEELKEVKVVEAERKEVSSLKNDKQITKIDLRDELKASPKSGLASKQTKQNNRLESQQQQLSSLPMLHGTAHEQSQRLSGMRANYQAHNDLGRSSVQPTQGLADRFCSAPGEEAPANIATKLPFLNKNNNEITTPWLSGRVTKAIEEQIGASRSLAQAAAISRQATITTHQQELLSDPAMKQVQQMGFSQLALMSSP